MAAAKKRRKKAVRRRASATRRGRKKSLPTWALIGAGLLAGVVIVLLVQFAIDRTREPNSGLRNLVKRAQQPARPQAKPKKQPVKKPAAKPKYDFYTILTESETVIPDTVSSREIKTEKNVSYVLQVGSFSEYSDADTLKARLAFSGLVAHIQKINVPNKGTFHRVRLGPYSDPLKLDKAHRKLKKLNIPALRLKVKG